MTVDLSLAKGHMTLAFYPIFRIRNGENIHALAKPR